MVKFTQQWTQVTWKDFLVDSRSIYYYKWNHTTGTLIMNFLKLGGKANAYVWFGYDPQKLLYHTIVQVSVSMNTDTINVKHSSTFNK